MYRIETQRSGVFGRLVRNQWRVFTRSLRRERGLAVWLLMGSFGVYLAFTLVVLGLFFNRFLVLLAPHTPPVDYINGHALSAFVALFGLRFLLQKSTRLKVQPYLHLPIRRSALVHLVQLSSLFSIHNIFPLLFFVPFWYRYIPNYAPGQTFWILGVLLIILGSHYANQLARSVLNQNTGLFIVFMGLGISLIAVDELLGTQVVQAISVTLFEGLLYGRWAVLALFVAGVLFLYQASSMAMLRSLLVPVATEARQRPVLRDVPWMRRFGQAGEFALMELKMMTRNKRPKQYLLVSFLFSTLYLVFLLINPRLYGSPLMGALIGLFASGGFVMNYGQLMFSWESCYFDGLMVRPIKPLDYLRAKVILLQVSCIVLYLVSLPLFLWLRPEMLSLHFAFLLYNIGVSTFLILFLAVRNKQRLDIRRTGGFFNYEGFSVMHWLWFFPTTLPTVLLLIVFRDTPSLGWLAIGGVGLLFLALTPLWTRHFARVFDRRRYKMAEGFRRDER